MNESTTAAKIMLVDDTPQNLKLLEGMLAEQDFRIFSFPRGDMALKAVKINPPDLILLDINMPGMDGYEVCERLKQDPATQNIPVIFISALNEPMDKVRAFGCGGVDYVTKPFQFEEVQARMATHLNIRSMQSALEQHNNDLSNLVQEKIGEIFQSQMATLTALGKLAESRDPETGQHIERVQVFCRLLAAELQRDSVYASAVDDVFVRDIFHASPLHDVGKVGIADQILLKPGRLTPEEFEIMKQHTVIGAETLTEALSRYPNNEFLVMGEQIARHHHEWWNGKGYPDGLAGTDIPLSARIMAVADVYDALRSRRCYKETMPHDKACEIMRSEAEDHFDPAVFEVFDRVKPQFAVLRAQLDE